MAFLQDVTDSLESIAERQHVRRLRAPKEDALVTARGCEARNWWNGVVGTLICGMD